MSQPTDFIPSIDTDRLLLRAHRPDDLRDCAAMWGNPDVTRHITGKTSSEEEVWGRVLRYIGHWALFRFGFWAVREKTSGRFVGDIGIMNFKRDSAPFLDGRPEAGWVLSPWAHGKGFATEGVRAALAWFDTQFCPMRTVCLIACANAPSIRVAAKCGYAEWRRADYKGRPTLVFERGSARTRR